MIDRIAHSDEISIEMKEEMVRHIKGEPSRIVKSNPEASIDNHRKNINLRV